MTLREVTTEERQQLMDDGVFDIHGNTPFHPGYTGIHRKPDGTYWCRQRADYGTDAWYTSEQQITKPEEIAMLDDHLAGLKSQPDTEPEPVRKPPWPSVDWFDRFIQWWRGR